MRLLLIFLSLLLSAQAQGPPNYPKAYTGTTVIQAGTAPFTSSSPIGTVVRLASPYNMRMSRITGPTLSCDGTQAWFTIPGGGGPAGRITNITSTLLAVVTAGNEACVMGYNASSMQVWPMTTLPTLCPGLSGFSERDPSVWYCLANANHTTPLGKANGTTLYAVTFAPLTGTLCGNTQQCYDPTSASWSVVIDFGICPLATIGNPTWHSNLGIDVNDANFDVGLSWTGGQNTGHLIFVYNSAAKTCSTVDITGDGAHPYVYRDFSLSGSVMQNYMDGTSLYASYSGLHETNLGNGWGIISAAKCTGYDCGTGNGDTYFRLSDYSAANINVYSYSSGHGAWTATEFENYGNPAIYLRPLSNLASVTKIARFGCVEDMHVSGDPRNDVNPLIGASGSVATTTWTVPDCNEVVGISLDGLTIFRFSPTWSSGPGTNFYGQYGITGTSFDRQTAFLTSDMLCQIRTPCGTDVFALDLTGN